MKNKIASYILVASLTLIGLAARADGPYLDAERMAQGHLLHNTDHYAGTLQSQVYSFGTWTTTTIDWAMTKDLWVTNMSINGTNIPLPKPLGGIPVPDNGYQNVYINLNALDKFGNYAEQGNLQTNFLGRGDSLSVLMFPQFPPVSVPIATPSDPYSINVVLTGANGYSWSYDPSTGAVLIQVGNILSTDITYKITDGTGKTLGEGTLPFFQNGPAGATNSIFNPEFAGGVIQFDIGTNGGNYMGGQKFNCLVTRKNAAVPAQVYQVSDVGNLSRLYVYAYDLNGGTIEVRKWVSSGVMPLIPASTSTDSYGTVTVVTSNYVDKAVITVLPGKSYNPANSFEIGVTRTY